VLRSRALGEMRIVAPYLVIGSGTLQTFGAGSHGSLRLVRNRIQLYEVVIP